MNNYKTEILAPAGSMEALVAAIRCGADAVYIGGKSFSARANATNFDNDELRQATEYAHKCGVKIYQTLNTLVFDDQIDELVSDIKYSASIGIDAFIVQDIGLASVVRQVCPDMSLHASTQMSIHTKEGAIFAKENGFCRVVVSRELSKEQIEEIVATGIEVEAFVHGALCMSVSGQCYMSAMIGSRSANRGLCAQACRLPFSATGEKDRHDLSLKDMSYMDYICEMDKMGVASLKIEGRMKRPEYVASAVSACKDVLCGKQPDMESLKAVFSRSGFTDGYYTDNTGKPMFGTRQKEDVVSAEKVFPKLRELYRKEVKITKIDFDITIKSNENIILKACDGDNNKVMVTGEVPQIAINRPTDMAMVEKQLSKLGDTVYFLGNVTGIIDEGLIVPASVLNELRRNICEQMNNARIKANTPCYSFNSFKGEVLKESELTNKKIRIETDNVSELENIDLTYVDKIIIPYDKWKKAKEFKDKIILSLPRYTKEEEYVIEELQSAKENGFDSIMCTNYAHISIGKKLGFVMHGDFGLNITNSQSLEELKSYGLVDATLSFELKLGQIADINKSIPCGIIAYGKLPLMLTVNCPVKQAVGCHKCTGQLTDRTGRNFSVKCGDDAVEILNCDTLYLADRLDEVKGIDFITLKFFKETPQKINEIISAYVKKEPPHIPEITRGLYYRGII